VNARVRSFLFSFQTKLILALTSVILMTIFLAGSVFVIRTRNEREQQALNRVAAASPAIYQQAFTALIPTENSADPFSDTLDDLGREQDMRILILSTGGVVLYDTGDTLTGYGLDVPASSVDDLERGFLAWNPDDEFPVQDITFVSASSRFVTGSGREVPFRIVLAVETNTIADAWLGVLPGLLIAALVAVPISALFGILLARQVAQPVKKLTAASEAIAGGDFTQRVEIERDDELGRLARSFTRMTERVGQRDAQMRALLANVSHDLKTPMTSITGYAQSLSDGTAPPEDVERIGTVIREEAEHVNRLLGDLLFLGEIDAG
jgi:HAMP domain-containing protein